MSSAGWLGNKQVFPSNELKNSSGEVEFTTEEGMSLFQYTVIHLAKAMLPELAGRYDESGLADMAVSQAVHLIRAIENAQVKIHESGLDELLS